MQKTTRNHTPSRRVIVYYIASMTILAAAKTEANDSTRDSLSCETIATQAGSSEIRSIAAPETVDQATLSISFSNTIRTRRTEDLGADGSDFTLTGSASIQPRRLLNSLDGTQAISATTSSGLIYRIDPTTQQQEWVRNLRRPSCSSDQLTHAEIALFAESSTQFQAQFSSDVVYVGTRYACNTGRTDNRIFALNFDTGGILWTFNGTATEDIDRVVGMARDSATDTLYVATDRTASSSQDSLWSFNGLTGSRNWSVNLGQLFGEPVVRGDRVYVNNLFGTVFAIDAGTGQTVWSYDLDPNAPVPTPFGVGLPPELSDTAEFVLVWDFVGRLHALRDLGATAASAWDRLLPRRPGAADDPVPGKAAITTPTIDTVTFVFSDNGRRVFAAGDQGSVYELDVATGDLVFEHQIDDVDVPIVSINQYTPIDSGGTPTGAARVLAGSGDGTLTRLCTTVLTDQDGDGITDDVDNCTLTPNPDQLDINGDGYGNICDADFNNDCVVNVIDLGIMRAVFFTGQPDVDLNGDGVVNVVDLGILRTLFFAPPGPSKIGESCNTP